MNRREQSPWSRDEVIDYVLDSYGGVESTERGRPKRVFIWEDDEGIWIGNMAAFAQHCGELFDFEVFPYDYVAINKIMIEVGERLVEARRREKDVGGPNQVPVQPDKRKVR